MKNDPESCSPYITSAEKIADGERRRDLLRAAGEAWPSIRVYSRAVLPDTVEPGILLDCVVGGVGIAGSEG